MPNAPLLPQREEYLRKKRKKKLVRYGIIFSLLAFVIGLASYISYRPALRISNIELVGGVLVTRAEVEKAGLEYMYGSYFLLFPKNNTFWYREKQLKKYLSETFRRIDTINIRRKNFTTLEVSITERKPFAIWCDSIPGSAPVVSIMEDGSITEHCYFLDQNSTIFDEAPYFSGDAYFKYYGLIPHDVNPIGHEYMTSTSVFYDISTFVDSVKSFSLRPQYLVAKGGDEFSLFILGGGEIYFDTKESLSKVAKNLEALLRTPALSTTTHKVLPVEYIDMRYGNKLFYKLRE